MKPTIGLDYAQAGTFTGIIDATGNLIQAAVMCEASGHIVGSLDTYALWFPWTVGVAAARTTHLDLFNASGSGRIVRVRSLVAVPGIVTAVVGLGFHWELLRTSTVGTGGSAITAAKMDTGYANLPAQVTARQKPTGGGTTDATFYGFGVHGEEGFVTGQLMPGVELLPAPVTLREGFGMKVDQVTNSVVGNFGWRIVFTTETP